MAGRVDVDALNASFDRIEEGNQRARKAAKGPAPAKATPAKATGQPVRSKPAATPKTATGSATSAEPVAEPAGGGSPVETGAGFLLGLLFWGWVAMPFLRGGPAEVKKVLTAKFLNKAPDGSWLP